MKNYILILLFIPFINHAQENDDLDSLKCEQDSLTSAVVLTPAIDISQFIDCTLIITPPVIPYWPEDPWGWGGWNPIDFTIVFTPIRRNAGEVQRIFAYSSCDHFCVEVLQYRDELSVCIQSDDIQIVNFELESLAKQLPLPFQEFASMPMLFHQGFYNWTIKPDRIPDGTYLLSFESNLQKGTSRIETRADSGMNHVASRDVDSPKEDDIIWIW